MLSFPFNSSTPVVYWNKQLFEKAGLDPNKPPKTWPETFDAAKKLRAAGAPCGFTATWISWTQIENFSAWHNRPIASEGNGLGGTDAKLEINNPLVTTHVANLAEAQKDNSFSYAGRETQPAAKFISGECGMTTSRKKLIGAKVEARPPVPSAADDRAKRIRPEIIDVVPSPPDLPHQRPVP